MGVSIFGNPNSSLSNYCHCPPPLIFPSILRYRIFRATFEESKEGKGQARRFRFCLGGGKCPPQAISNFLTHILSNFYDAIPPTHAPRRRHVLAISNGIVNLPEYILTNSHFHLEKNEIVIEY